VATVLLTGTRPMVRPNGPRDSRHRLIVETDQRVRFGARRVIEKAWPPLAGLSWPHPSWAPYDLIHSFNAIPITASKPFVVTFESVLPRTLGPGGAALGARIRDRLATDLCRGLIAMSAYARGKFLKANRGWGELDEVDRKIRVIYPHFEARTAGGVASIRRYARGTPLRLVFVGNDFARKGGIVALRAVRRAVAAGLPVKLDIVSAFRLGGDVYTDHADAGRYGADLQALSHPAITVHGRQPNARVLALMADAHLQVLATMDDTFGYGVVEGYSVGTPAMTTSVCAMPELVGSDAGALLDLPVDAWGNWVGLPRGGVDGSSVDRTSAAYWATLDAAYDGLADQLVEQLAAVVDDGEQIERWSVGATTRFERDHESRQVSERLDALYDAALGLGEAPLPQAPLGVD
jgi:glycosyltransferase involved in cell wall biosynthesis